jgi:peptidoglycan/LPS O-acetylase OafA/YrhL
MIKPLTSWRGIFAVSIFLLHSGLKQFDQLSWCGVVFFFMVSGFLLASRHQFNEINGKAYRNFLAERALRIYPVHWLALILFVVLQLLFFSFTFHPSLIANALLVQSYIPLRDFFFSYNKISWFLCDIVFCYACYPLLVRALRKIRLAVQIAVAVAITVAYAIVLSQVSIDVKQFLFVFPPMRLIDFGIGIVAYNIYASLAKKDLTFSFIKSSAVECAALLLLAAVITLDVLFQQALDWYDATLLWWLPVAVLLITAALLNGREGVIGRLLSWRPLLWLGAISFEVYIFHGVLATLSATAEKSFFAHFGIPVNDLYLAIPTVILLSWLIHIAFTSPLHKWAHKVLRS